MLKLNNRQVCNGYKYINSFTIMAQILRLKIHVNFFNTNTVELFSQNRDKNKIK